MITDIGVIELPLTILFETFRALVYSPALIMSFDERFDLRLATL